MTSQQYWKNRIALANKAYDKHLADTEVALAKQYLTTSDRLLNEIKDLYDDIQKGNFIVSDLYKFNKYYDLINQMNKELTKLGKKEITILDTKFTSMYNTTAKIIGEGLGFNMVNPTAAKEAIYSVWAPDKKVGTSRIGTHKDLLRESLEKGLVDCVASGLPKDKLVERLMTEFNRGFTQTDRLVRTELSYVQNKSTMDKYEEAHLEQYEFLCADDERTGDECGDLDGKRFKVKDAEFGVNCSPIHPFAAALLFLYWMILNSSAK